MREINKWIITNIVIITFIPVFVYVIAAIVGIILVHNIQNLAVCFIAFIIPYHIKIGLFWDSCINKESNDYKRYLAKKKFERDSFRIKKMEVERRKVFFCNAYITYIPFIVVIFISQVIESVAGKFFLLIFSPVPKLMLVGPANMVEIITVIVSAGLMFWFGFTINEKEIHFDSDLKFNLWLEYGSPDIEDELQTDDKSFYKLYHREIEVISNFVKSCNRNLSVEFCETGIDNTIAFADLKNKSIVLNKKLLTDDVFSIQAILGITAHEIIHHKIKNKQEFISNFIPFLLFIIIYVPIALYLDEISRTGVFFFIFALGSLMLCFVHFIMTVNESSFWSQLTEIKCDRLACELVGVTKENLYEGLASIKLYLERFNSKSKLNTLTNTKDKYFTIKEHPNLTYRIHLINNYKKWNELEFFKHAVIMVIWLITGKGWSGDES